MHDAEKLPVAQINDASDNEPKDPLIGTVLLKRYEVLEQIGTGRFSVVYKARQLLMNRMVAIKSLKRDLLDEKEVVARFKKEARALSRLRHPNIVAVFDCFESQNGRPYLVMDYLEGMSLEDLLAKDHCLTAEMAKPIFLQVCDALQHAHKHGVLHRDLKPGNMVLLAETKGTELVQLVDFGLAQVEEEVQKLTQDGECCGSPAYMSPEHCTGEALDGRSDIYSMGVVMYETLTGVVPFKGRTSVETMRLQVYENPPPFRKVRPDMSVPADIEDTVLRCLQKEPHKRFQTAAQVKEAVLNWGKSSVPGRTVIPAPPSGSNGADDGRQVPQVTEAPSEPAPVAPVPSKTKEWAQVAATAKQPHEVPQTAKLKKWTDAQEKAVALRIPILVACFLGTVLLAVAATLIFSHQGKNLTNEMHLGGGNSAMTSPEATQTSPGISGSPIDEDQPPSTVALPVTPSLPSPSVAVSKPPASRPTTGTSATGHPTATAEPLAASSTLTPEHGPVTATPASDQPAAVKPATTAAMPPVKPAQTLPAPTPKSTATATVPARPAQPPTVPTPKSTASTTVPQPAQPAHAPESNQAAVAPPVKPVTVVSPKPATASNPPTKPAQPVSAKPRTVAQPAVAHQPHHAKPAVAKAKAPVVAAAEPKSKAPTKKPQATVAAAKPAPQAPAADASGNVHRHAYSSYGRGYGF